jgi:hypothetical protein
MPKFKVEITYDITIHETFMVEIDDDDAEALEAFDESPYDLCNPENRTEKVEGDVREGSWNEDVEEIPVLDRIVQAINDSE